MPTPHTPPVSAAIPPPVGHGSTPQPALTPQLANADIALQTTPPVGPAPSPHLSAHNSHSSDSHQYTISHSRILPPPRLNLAFSRDQSHSTDSPPRHASSHTASAALADADGNVKHNIPQLSEHHRHERPSTVLATFFHRWLPSLLSTRPVRHTFTRNLDNAIRGVIAFVVAAIIAVQWFAVDLLAVPYLFLVFAVTTIRPTVGGTLAGMQVQFAGVATAVVMDMIITGAQISRLPQVHRIIVCEVVLFVTSIGLAYYFHPPLARRFALAIHALIMVEIALGVDQVVLPLQTLLTMVLAYCVAFVLITLPFPRLARDELLDRYQQSLLTLSAVFREIVRCYLSTEPIAPQVLNTALASQLEAVFKSLTVMRRLQVEATMECSLYTLAFPSSISVGNPVLADPDRIEQLYWLNVNLLNTLSTLHYSSYHAAFVHYLRDAFRHLSKEQSRYLTMLGSPDSSEVTRECVEKCKQRLDDAMAEAWQAYTKARRKLYGYGTDERHSTEQVRAAAERRKQRNSIWKEQVGPPHHSHSDDDTDYAVDHSARQSQESGRLLVKAEAQSGGGSHQPSEPSILLHSTQEVFWRSTFFYYLVRFHHAVHLLPLDHDVLAVSPTSKPHAVPAASSTSSAADSSPTSVWPRKRFALQRLFIQLIRDPLSWSFIGFHPVDDAVYLVRTAVQFVRKPTIDWSWMRGSIIISFIVCVASLIAVIPQLSSRTVFPNAYWCPFTAAILASDTQGAMVQRAFHRLFGTLLGGLIGYLILYAFPANWYGSIPLLGLWCFVMQFVQNSSYAYLGMLASFTPIIIVFGYQLPGSNELSLERFALSRMEEITIGIVIAVVLSSVLWPVNSIRLLRSEMMVSVESFKAAVGRTSEIYDRLVQDDQRDTTGDKAEKEEQKQASDQHEERLHGTRDVEIEIVTIGKDDTHSAAATAGGSAKTGGDEMPPSPLPSPQAADAVDVNEQKSQPHINPRWQLACHQSLCLTAAPICVRCMCQCWPLFSPTPAAYRCHCRARAGCWVRRPMSRPHSSRPSLPASTSSCCAHSAASGRSSSRCTPPSK